MLSVVISAHFEFGEWVYSRTRRWEFLQLDEAATGPAVLAVGLIWLCERVEIAGGSFELRSAPGRGLSFEILMPTTAHI